MRRAICLLSLALWSSVGLNSEAAEPRYRVAYATYVGGKAWDQAREVIVYPDGSVLVGGMTASDDFPTTEGVVQPKYAGDDPALGHGGIYGGDCFLVRLSPDGKTILAATYFGGSKQERAVYGMGLDSKGNVVLTSATRSPDFPTTPGAAQTKLGGKTDAFLTRLSPDGRRFTFSTFLGGSDGEFTLMPTPDPQGNIVLVGTTRSRDFPVTPDAVQGQYGGSAQKWDGDGVFAVLSPDGSKILYATYLGGKGGDLIRSVALGPEGEIYLVGSTFSADFPVTPDAAQTTLGGHADAFVVKLVPTR